MSIIAALLPHQDRLRRLQTAIRGRHQIAPCADWGALHRLCETQPISTAVFDLFATGEMQLEPVRQLRRLFPRLITVAYVTVGNHDRIRDIFDAGRAGIDGLVLADRDDSADRFAALLEQAEARSVASKLKALFAGMHPLVRDAVLISVTRAHERLTPEVLARSLSLGRRALVRRLSDAGFPPPRRLITWGRLIVAAQLLEDPLRSADAVSLALDFPSGSAFRNTCQRYLKSTPSQLRQRGGAEYVIAGLMQDGPRGDDEG
ncbi:MAG TPA: helix-turn-helix domain-containing protein [Gemmatimonadaceae bacterium]|jgi:AraC-like DNA-binding protein|nr:helix-turn-helix domain-containing protein [Gemmatimonadaceae bacterium]